MTLDCKICDRCGRSLFPVEGICDDPQYAILQPEFGYDSGLDLIKEGPNKMQLCFCEICYRTLLSLIGLGIRRNPEKGYYWLESKPVAFVSADDLTATDSAADNSNVINSWETTAWPYLNKEINNIPESK